MPEGSFPTYRFCGSGLAAEAVRPMAPSLEATPQEVNRWFFTSEDGKAGAVKKRGDMVRFQLGWIDRLYVGTGAGAGGGSILENVRQGDPLAVQDCTGCH